MSERDRFALKIFVVFIVLAGAVLSVTSHLEGVASVRIACQERGYLLYHPAERTCIDPETNTIRVLPKD
jgi:hypothetical protein